METVRSVLYRVRGSLLLVPLIVLVICVGLARLTINIDRTADNLADVALVLSVSLAGGRAIATAVAGATITVAAIVFSITALSSQIAATQYSPRAVAGFVEDRIQKLVIGLVVGTFAFALMVLAALGGAADPEIATNPSVSVTLVLLLGVASVIAIVGYLDHSLRRMRIDAVVRRIAEATVDAVHRHHRRSDGGGSDEEGGVPDGSPYRVVARRPGWVRYIEAERLVNSLPHGASVRIEVRVGEALFEGDLIATLWPGETRGAPDPSHVVERAVHVGRDRTLANDPGYGIRQLVDIGLRALSPGINDPTTAVDVVQHLKLPLREILFLVAPVRVLRGPDGQRVFLAEAASRSDHVHGAFAEIRLAASRQPEVLRALLEIISDLVGELRAEDLEGRTGALVAEAKLTIEAAREAGFPEADLERVVDAARHMNIEAEGDHPSPDA